MKNVLSAMLLMMILVLTSCTKDRITGGGTITTENRNVKNFTKVSIAGSTNVTIIKGQAFEVKVKGYSNLLPYFDTKVINGTLEMGFKEHVNVNRDNTEVSVTLPALDGLSVAGSADMISTGDFININMFETTIAGSGSITIQHGSAVNFSASIIGSGDINAFSFTADNASVSISGSGDTRITANNKLHVEIAGSGNVFYHGSPLISTIISGSGRVLKQ